MTEPKAAPAFQAGLYIRVSTKDQALKYSPDVQRAILLKKAEDDSVTVREEDIFLDKQTGTNSNRPGFERMQALAQSGAIQIVYVMSVDRFARNTEDALRVARLLKERGARLVIADLPMDIQTPEGELAYTQFAAFAQFQAAQIKKYARGGRDRRLDHEKKPDHGSAAHGWDLKDGVFVLNEAEAKINRLIFMWRVREQMPKTAIAARLMREGYKPRRATRWGHQVVSQILSSRMNIGEHHRSGRILPCPPTIDRETFEAAQRLNEVIRRKCVGRPSRLYLLRGMAWCKKCGHRILGEGRKPNGHYYYRCGNGTRSPN